jgi:type IV pilus biogenesis protein CpaD/CtpE
VTLRASSSVVLAAVAVLGVTACSSSKKSTTSTTTTAGSAKSPIVVKTPIPNSQWRSPISVKGTTSLPGELTIEVLSSAGKQLGSRHTSATDGHFSVVVPFSAKQRVPGAVLVHDEHSDHSVQVSVVLTP